MDKEKIKKLAGDPQFISGIYNYCDRWCERCPLTARCLNYALAEEESTAPETRDVRNKAFWEQLTEALQVTLELVREAAEEHGIDLDSLDEEGTRDEEDLRDEMARSHACCRAAREYADMVDDWFRSAKALFGEQEDGADLEDPSEAWALSSDLGEGGLAEAIEVIRWYQYQIYVKLMRAVRSELREKEEELEAFSKDSEGSAKVALIGLDRSIAAWGQVSSHFPMIKKEILNILVHLDRLRRNVEKTFPGARSFIRPGFDKVDLNG